jgi:hypothetical protein
MIGMVRNSCATWSDGMLYTEQWLLSKTYCLLRTFEKKYERLWYGRQIRYAEIDLNSGS